MIRFFFTPFVFTGFLLVSLIPGQESAHSGLTPPVITQGSTLGSREDLEKTFKALETPDCGGHYRYMEHPITVRDFVGGNVRNIRVVHFFHVINSSTLEQLPNLVREVWQGKFQSASCQIDWDEYTVWSVEAVVEFEDGKKSVLITDGSHVALQDHNGKSSFLRLYPDAQ